MPVTGLKKWRLIQLLRRHDIDEQEVDWDLSQEEVVEQVRRLVGMTEQDYINYFREVPEIERQLISDCQEIARREMRARRELKQAKYDMGIRILQDESYLISHYGDNYFGELARLISMRGYSTDQLRKCVKFAQEYSEENARGLIEDDNVGWEHIRRVVLAEIRFLPPFADIQWQGCSAVTTRLSQITQINAMCRDKNCVLYKLCRRISKETESLRQLQFCFGTF